MIKNNTASSQSTFTTNRVIPLLNQANPAPINNPNILYPLRSKMKVLE